MATEVILIRHGNAVRVNGDYYHAPLTPLGQEQAAQTGEYFSALENHLDGFYASPLRRAMEAAHIIGQKAELRIGVQELRMIELPALMILEILSITEPIEDYLEARAGGPIRWPIEGRFSTVLLDIIAGHSNQRVAVVAHAWVISATLSWYLPEERWQWWRTTVSNCLLTRFKVEGNHGELLAVNDIQQMSPVLITFQPPTNTVEVVKVTHPVGKELVFDKVTDKKK